MAVVLEKAQSGLSCGYFWQMGTQGIKLDDPEIPFLSCLHTRLPLRAEPSGGRQQPQLSSPRAQAHPYTFDNSLQLNSVTELPENKLPSVKGPQQLAKSTDAE